ncbi:exported hypothetical protein [Frankia sp. Hr75.2]|nr:exported hypothetical protein [Frankia sp. Hr75.2]
MCGSMKPGASTRPARSTTSAPSPCSSCSPGSSQCSIQIKSDNKSFTLFCRPRCYYITDKGRNLVATYKSDISGLRVRPGSSGLSGVGARSGAMERECLNPAGAWSTVGCSYSHVVKIISSNGLIFLAGQAPADENFKVIGGVLDALDSLDAAEAAEAAEATEAGDALDRPKDRGRLVRGWRGRLVHGAPSGAGRRARACGLPGSRPHPGQPAGGGRTAAARPEPAGRPQRHPGRPGRLRAARPVHGDRGRRRPGAGRAGGARPRAARPDRLGREERALPHLDGARRPCGPAGLGAGGRGPGPPTFPTWNVPRSSTRRFSTS